MFDFTIPMIMKRRGNKLAIKDYSEGGLKTKYPQLLLCLILNILITIKRRSSSGKP